MEPSFRIEFGACFLLALGFLILPLDWLLGAVVAAAVHELCHYLAGKLQGVKCFSIQIEVGGAVMNFGPLSRNEELFIAAAGPLGSLALFCFIHIYPQLAVCAGVQGLFNLLPIWPLDGGRITACLLRGREGLCRVIECATAVMILGFGLWLGRKLGIYPILFAGIVTVKAFSRKIPCKPAVLGVQ